MKQNCFFSDSIFSCLGKLVCSASYGVFKDCLLNGELRKAVVDMQTYISNMPRFGYVPITYDYEKLSSKLRKLEQLVVAAAAKARRKTKAPSHGHTRKKISREKRKR